VSELERRLHDLGGEIAYPATPRFDLGFERRPSRLRPLALGLAVVLAVLAGVLALSPGARSAFLELFRLDGATVELVETLPQVEVQEPGFGRRVSRAEAERRIGFRLLDVGEPDAIFLLDDRMATVVYGPVAKPRLVLSQLNGAVYEGFVKKVANGRTRVEGAEVEGERALFVSGAEHVVMFLDEQGQVADDRTFLAGNVLLWNHGDLLLRLEGDLTRAEALELARSAE
jgi:hypothetical protein